MGSNMQNVVIKMTEGKIFNGTMKKPGAIILRGQISPRIEPEKVLNAIKLGQTRIELVEKKEENPGSGGPDGDTGSGGSPGTGNP